MRRLTPAIGRYALIALTLAATGCTGASLDFMGQLGINLGGEAEQTAALSSEALAAHQPQAGGPSPNGSANGANGASENQRSDAQAVATEDIGDSAGAARTELAMLPIPARPAQPRKPEAGRAICGALAPGQRGIGSVESNGLQFTVECFRSKQAGTAPGIIILHGARGIGRNTIYERLAEHLNARGHHAFIFQYLGAAETAPVVLTGKSPPKGAAARLKTPPRKRGVDSEAQTQAIDRAITAVQALPYVDHERIGMFGLSLGGFHALAIASRDERIGAVVDMFGAMPRPVGPTVTRMPPTLVLHGDRDAVVPVRRAQELAKLLKSIGASYEVKIYKGQGHSFTGAADQDSVERSVEFLERWLRAQSRTAG
ncbi:MAG: dienelactone hydrolase family protein [Alphaproteobacteria bacterium]|nr:dienelactone hydrolase family protein [Alphaproteobacteria bacterium]